MDAEFSIWDHFFRLDLTSSSPLILGLVCLVLVLQWSGSIYSWVNGRIISLRVLFVLLGPAFIGVQIWRRNRGTVPLRIIK